MFLCYASEEGAAFIDRALYLPREWAQDSARREEAGVPEGVRFATKGEQAKEMLKRAFGEGVPAGWVVADTVTVRLGVCGLGSKGRDAPTCWRCRGPMASTIRSASGGRGRWPRACRKGRGFGPRPGRGNTAIWPSGAAKIAVLSRIDLRGWPTTFTAAPTLDQDWLTLNAPVREALARLEAYQLDAELQNLWPALKAWTNRPSDPWQIHVPATATGAVAASRLVAIYGPEGVLPDDPADLTTVAVGLLDSWGETIPDVEQATGAAFGFNAPAARAPQAILLAVPPVETEPLTPEVLVDIVAETRELAWARMASPAELHAFKAALPLMMLPASGITAVELDS